MVQRRTLVDGLSSKTPTSEERDFVFSGSHSSEKPKPHPTPRKVPRTPLTTRLRDDYAQSIKRVSLQRQIDGIEPSSVQAIIEEAVGAWLAAQDEPLDG